MVVQTQDPPFSSSSKDSPGAGYKPSGKEEKKDVEDPGNEDNEVPITEEPRVNQEKDSVNSTNRVNAVSSTVNAVSNEVDVVGRKSSIETPDDPNMPELEDIGIFEDSNKDGHIQEEGIDYDEVFAPVARIKAIRLFLAYASFKDFVVYQMNVKSVFLYEKIKEEVYVFQPSGLKDPDFLDKVYKVEKALYGLHQAPREWIFRYLKGQPKLGLWFLKDLPFDLVAYTDSDYARASLDRKSTTGGCQFQGCRLISWQCKKQTVVANSTTEAKYIATSNCCG
nr:ribonuclease H-like domain-containing protein [Tanacetum cinerariifolium]